MKSPKNTILTTLTTLAITALMVLACGSPDQNETTEQQTSASQPIAAIQTSKVEAPTSIPASYTEVTTQTEQSKPKVRNDRPTSKDETVRPSLSTETLYIAPGRTPT